MYFLETLVKRIGNVTGPGRWLSKSRLALSACLLYTCLLSTAHAEVIEVLNIDFETDPPNFQIALQEQGDATASFEFGDVVGSRGMIFKGTYQTKMGVDEFENANGILNPLVPTFEDYHLYPSETDGVHSISMSMDAIVDGLASDNENSQGLMGLSIQLWQVKDGQWDVYQRTQFFSNLTLAKVSLSEMTAEDFKREDDTMPDFSATAQPIAFGFFGGIGYKWLSGPGIFISTSARVDNWKVEANVGLTILKDSFEE